MLSERQVQDVCLVYKGSLQCRYLDGDPDEFDKFYCKKKTPDKKVIDEMAAEFEAECAKNGTNPLDSPNALGDNCAGYTCFKDILQGYDV
jgi:hypothetical protein